MSTGSFTGGERIDQAAALEALAGLELMGRPRE